MLKDLRELEKDINFIKLELEKNLSNEDKNLLLTLMDLQNIKQKRLWDLAYIEREELIKDGIVNLTKKKIINKVLNMNNDNLEEVISIIDILNDPNMKTDDISKIKFVIYRRFKPKKIILKTKQTPKLTDNRIEGGDK